MRNKAVHEELVSAIRAAQLACPSLPTGLPDENVPVAFVAHRLRELIAIWRGHGLEPYRVEVACGSELHYLLTFGWPLRDIDGVDIVVAEPQPALFRALRGWFDVTLHIAGRGNLPVPVAHGLAYPSLTEPWIHEAHWLIQQFASLAALDVEATTRQLINAHGAALSHGSGLASELANKLRFMCAHQLDAELILLMPWRAFPYPRDGESVAAFISHRSTLATFERLLAEATGGDANARHTFDTLRDDWLGSTGDLLRAVRSL